MVQHKLVHVNLTGLTPNTAYTAQVHAVCAPGDTSTASPSVSCLNAVAPYTQDFGWFTNLLG